MAVGGRVDEFSFSDVHGGVSDLVGRRAKEEQVPGPQILTIDSLNSPHAACRSASRGMVMPRLRTSICVKPEQS
jgi:hypothetical protein